MKSHTNDKHSRGGYKSIVYFGSNNYGITVFAGRDKNPVQKSHTDKLYQAEYTQHHHAFNHASYSSTNLSADLLF